MDHRDVEREGPVCQREFRVQKSDDKGQVRSDILLLLLIQVTNTWGFPGGSVGKESA